MYFASVSPSTSAGRYASNASWVTGIYPALTVNSVLISGSVIHFRKTMAAFSRSGVDLSVQNPAPRCITSFSPSSNTGQGRAISSLFSEVLSGYVTMSE